MLSSGPYPVSAGTPITATPPSGSTRFVTVVLSNQSPYLCSIDMGGAAGPFLQPYAAQMYACDGGGYPTITPVTNTSPNSAVTGGYVSADWYLAADTITGAYPAPLVSQSTTVQNVPNGVVTTYVKSPPAINSIAAANQSTTSSTTNAVSPANPTGIAVGNLVLAKIVFQSNITAGQSYTAAVAPSGSTVTWYGAMSNAAVSPGNIYTGSFLLYGIYSGSTLGTFTVTMSNGAFAVNAAAGVLCVGSGGNNAFSNQTLTGAVSDNVTWSASGSSDGNLILPSTSPGLFVGSFFTPTGGALFSVGSIYTTAGLWLASSQTGTWGASTNMNPESTTGVLYDRGLVIPQ